MKEEFNVSPHPGSLGPTQKPVTVRPGRIQDLMGAPLLLLRWLEKWKPQERRRICPHVHQQVVSSRTRRGFVPFFDIVTLSRPVVGSARLLLEDLCLKKPRNCGRQPTLYRGSAVRAGGRCYLWPPFRHCTVCLWLPSEGHLGKVGASRAPGPHGKSYLLGTKERLRGLRGGKGVGRQACRLQGTCRATE